MTDIFPCTVPVPWSKKKVQKPSKFENNHFIKLYIYNMKKRIVLKSVEF